MRPTYVQAYKTLLYVITLLYFIRLGHPTIYISFAITILLLILYVSQKKKNTIYSMGILVFVVLEILLTILQMFRQLVFRLSDINVPDLIFLYGEMFLLLLIFPIYEIFCAKGIDFFREICRIALFVLILKAIVWYLFNFRSIDIGYYYIGGAERWVRFALGRTLYRMTGTALDGFIFSYFIVNFFTKSSLSEKIKSLIYMAFLYFFAMYISQSRVQLIYYTVSLLIGLLYYSIHTKNKAIVRLSIVLLLALAVFLFRNVIVNFMNSFSLNSNIGDSTQIRMLEYRYFDELWRRTSYLFGFGMINEPIIMNGIAYWLSDLGIADILYQFGVVGLFVGLIPFILGAYKTIKVIKIKESSLNFFFVCSSSYYIASISNINPYRNVNYLTLPFYIAFLLYVIKINVETKKKREN